MDNTITEQQQSPYFIPPSETDIDLVSTVREILVNSGRGLALNEKYDQHHFIKEAVGKTPDVQRFLMNRYWNNQLIESNKSSHEERYCLIGDGTIDQWLVLFNTKIVPFIIENGLPN